MGDFLTNLVLICTATFVLGLIIGTIAKAAEKDKPADPPDPL